MADVKETKKETPKASEPKVLDAKKEIKLEDIRFNEKNKTIAIFEWIPIVDFVMLFSEKEDYFVKYNAAQSAVLSLLMILTPVPCLGWVLFVGGWVLKIMGMIKASKGELFQVPVVKDLALKIVNAL